MSYREVVCNVSVRMPQVGDSLTETIDFLMAGRDHAVATDEYLRRMATDVIGPPKVAMTPEVLDTLIVNLNAARVRERTLRRQLYETRATTVIASCIVLGGALVAVVGLLAR